jgi:cytochrome b561
MLFMGGGHGTYLFGKLFFPIPMIIAGINDRITDLAFYLAIIQIPIYGLLIFYFRKSNWKLVSKYIILIHIILCV